MSPHFPVVNSPQKLAVLTHPPLGEASPAGPQGIRDTPLAVRPLSEPAQYAPDETLTFPRWYFPGLREGEPFHSTLPVGSRNLSRESGSVYNRWWHLDAQDAK